MDAETLAEDVTPAFGLAPERQEILDSADRYARAQLYPLAERMDREEWWPQSLFGQLGRDGYFGITVPAEHGGTGGDLFASALVLQAFARWNHAIALSWVAHENLCLNNLFRHGSLTVRQKYLPGLCAGTAIGALGLTEPGAGSDAIGSMRTSARLDGECYVLNGTKIFITNGPVADVLLVYAKTAPERGSRGVSAFVVERGFPGFRVAQKLTKMGFRGSQTGELVFENCRVPRENLVGKHDGGAAVLMDGLDLERAMIAPLCLGIAERALDLAVDYAKHRVQFGRPIAQFQMIRAKLAEMFVRVESMRAFIYSVLGHVNSLEAGRGGHGTAHALTAASVMHASEAMGAVLADLVQIHGGSGYIWEAEANRLFRATKLLEIGAGTTEVRKLIISDEILKR